MMTYSCKGEHKSVQNLTEPNCQSFSQFPHPEYGYFPPEMGSQSIPCYPSPTLTAVIHVFPIPCLYPFLLLKPFRTSGQNQNCPGKIKAQILSSASSVHKSGPYSYQRIPPPISWIYHSFVYFVDFVQFLLGTNFQSRQSIRTCKMLVMTENFSKQRETDRVRCLVQEDDTLTHPVLKPLCRTSSCVSILINSKLSEKV